MLLSTVEGTISLVNITSQKVDWTFHTNEPIYSSYKAPHYHYTDDAPVLGDDFYMDCDKDWRLYNSSMRKGKRINEVSLGTYLSFFGLCMLSLSLIWKCVSSCLFR